MTTRKKPKDVKALHPQRPQSNGQKPKERETLEHRQSARYAKMFGDRDYDDLTDEQRMEWDEEAARLQDEWKQERSQEMLALCDRLTGILAELVTIGRSNARKSMELGEVVEAIVAMHIEDGRTMQWIWEWFVSNYKVSRRTGERCIFLHNNRKDVEKLLDGDPFLGLVEAEKEVKKIIESRTVKLEDIDRERHVTKLEKAGKGDVYFLGDKGELMTAPVANGHKFNPKAAQPAKIKKVEHERILAELKEKAKERTKKELQKKADDAMKKAQEASDELKKIEDEEDEEEVIRLGTGEVIKGKAAIAEAIREMAGLKVREYMAKPGDKITIQGKAGDSQSVTVHKGDAIVIKAEEGGEK